MPDSESHPSDAQFVDTNVFLRFLTNDVPEQAAVVSDLLATAAAGDLRLTTNPRPAAGPGGTHDSAVRFWRQMEMRPIHVRLATRTRGHTFLQALQSR